jgi:hypothetical protein
MEPLATVTFLLDGQRTTLQMAPALVGDCVLVLLGVVGMEFISIDLPQ